MKLFSWYNIALGLMGFGLNEWESVSHEVHPWAVFGIAFMVGAYLYCGFCGQPGLRDSY